MLQQPFFNVTSQLYLAYLPFSLYLNILRVQRIYSPLNHSRKAKGRNRHFKGRKKGEKDILNTVCDKEYVHRRVEAFLHVLQQRDDLGGGTKAQNYNEICPWDLPQMSVPSH